jgi:hypothetical protein
MYDYDIVVFPEKRGTSFGGESRNLLRNSFLVTPQILQFTT